MSKRNPYLASLPSGYLFPEIQKRVNAYKMRNPDAQLISLGVGNTTEPLAPHIVKRLSEKAAALGTTTGYTGYGPAEGYLELRQKIAEVIYKGRVDPDEIFISDGAKCDMGRLQHLFGDDATIAIQDPSYPVYVDTTIITGKKEPVLLPCTPENDFIPDLDKTPRTDLLFFCSPNNPTGAVSTKPQLEKLVSFCKKNKTILIFDSAYAFYIQDPELPKSIYEIEGAKEIAIEVGSFSKMAGFTGMRLGWTVIPKALKFSDGSSVWKDWDRIVSTFFNGASYLTQMAGIAALEEQGLKEIQDTIQHYLENGKLLRQAFEGVFPIHGGVNSPFLWLDLGKRDSWEVFNEFLEEKEIITTPGSGFGPAGEGFLRLSIFGSRATIESLFAKIV